MKLKNIFTLSALATAVAFSGSALAKDGKIKVGIQTGPEFSVAEVAKQVAKDQFGLEVELVPFTDYVTPNVALEEKSIDANAFQHKPYLDAQVEARGLKGLVIVGNTFVYPIAAYSKKISKLDELKDGATVAIPNDPTNGGRSLLLLQAQGLLKLKEGTGLTPTALDIVENPKKLKIRELEAPLLPQVLPEVDLAVINNTYAGQAGLFPSTDAIFVEDKDSPYVNIIVAREDNKEDQDVVNFVKAYNSEAVYEKAKQEFKDSVVKGW
ncbi:D-methionine transport system substrate-binding protein [Pasteurella testudinis DSM 23072]|uniref:Lipoprotein n=1 Tax=Pasteurella testudinis DSM 23072 TaxID=1122938 RepID=A0A1W1URN6_9PAST|nr:methionine ABC transporter substrate-binding lipoprotein MetQ [Pasteurella testudinis]SMB83471.1 D-methionine transport system substrate-binding protein [Pasteurella testudinis DSM 23072]SUB51082.1 D-methionine-binding lipoprotein MetQ [Pasteurella testudinis]